MRSSAHSTWSSVEPFLSLWKENDNYPQFKAKIYKANKYFTLLLTKQLHGEVSNMPVIKKIANDYDDC